jgi:hypothetical protein
MNQLRHFRERAKTLLRWLRCQQVTWPMATAPLTHIFTVIYANRRQDLKNNKTQYGYRIWTTGNTVGTL